jgi:CRISPR-associated protein Cas1
MALHALVCYECLFYLEDVQEIRVADDRLYSGRELHKSLEAKAGDAWESLELPR